MDMKIRSVCVYCSSSAHIDQIYKTSAEQLGHLLAKKNLRLVYGGGSVGLMGILSRACMHAGGQVLGITTRHLEQYEISNKAITQLLVVDSMAERIQLLLEKADALIVLPGGFGTLEEFFGALTSKQIGLHKKPIVLCNLNGFWENLRQLLSHTAQTGFASPKDTQLCQFVDTVDEVLPALFSSHWATVSPTEKWFK